MICEVIVGAFLAGIIGIITVYLTKQLEEKRTKKYTSRALLSEVEANQNRLQLLDTPSRALEDSKKEIKESSSTDTNIDQIMENIKHLRSISFDRAIYSALSDKIGLLEPKSRECVVQYYVKIKFMEDKLRLIQEISLTSPPDYGKDNYSKMVLSLITRTKTEKEAEEFFTNAVEAYKIGEELIKSLKEQI